MLADGVCGEYPRGGDDNDRRRESPGRIGSRLILTPVSREIPARDHRSMRTRRDIRARCRESGASSGGGQKAEEEGYEAPHDVSNLTQACNTPNPDVASGLLGRAPPSRLSRLWPLRRGGPFLVDPW